MSVRKPIMSEDFAVKLFWNGERWIERLPKLVGLFESAVIVVPNSGLDPFTCMGSKSMRKGTNVNEALLLPEKT